MTNMTVKVKAKVVASKDAGTYQIISLPLPSTMIATLLRLKKDPNANELLVTLADVWAMYHFRCRGQIESYVFPELGIGNFAPFQTASDELQWLLINHPATKDLFAAEYDVEVADEFIDPQAETRPGLADSNAIKTVRKAGKGIINWFYN